MPSTKMDNPLESQDGLSGFTCDKGHRHTDPLGSTGILVVRPRKLQDGEPEILVLKKFDLSFPEPPSWHAVPWAYRLCGEPEERCAMRATEVEMGLTRESFHFSAENIHRAKECSPFASIILATPGKKMGPHVGHHWGHHYSFILVSDIVELEVAEGLKIDNATLCELIKLLPEPPKKGLLPALKRAFSST